MEILESMAKSLKAGDDKKITEEVTQTMEQEIPSIKLLDDSLIAGMQRVVLESVQGDLHEIGKNPAPTGVDPGSGVGELRDSARRCVGRDDQRGLQCTGRP